MFLSDARQELIELDGSHGPLQTLLKELPEPYRRVRNHWFRRHLGLYVTLRLPAASFDCPVFMLLLINDVI